MACYREVLERDPSRRETRRNLAQTLAMAGDAAAAEALFRELLDTDPGDRASRTLLVDLLEGQNRVDEAEEVLCDAPAAWTMPTHCCESATCSCARARSPMPRAATAPVLAQAPGHPVAQNNLALVRAMRGDRDGAERLLRRIIGEQPAYLEPWRNLMALRTCRDPDDPDIRAMRAIEAGAGLADGARMQLAFALGKALDDCGRHDEAFDRFRLANELRRREAPFDAGALAEHARRIREVFDGEFLAGRADWGSDSMLPVMIVGMPRTGTTLLEQILSAHPAFHGAGELLLINRLITRLERPAAGGEVRAYPECVRELAPGTVDALARDYLAALRALAPDDATLRVGDKMPYNFFHLGLVRLLFPRGLIIHMRRHPLDACVSAYFNYFPRGLDFTSSFEDLAAFYGIYDDMMTHWRDRASVDILDVFYEELVADPRGQIARVLDRLDLPLDRRDAGFSFPAAGRSDTERPAGAPPLQHR
ncbi:MAG: sulfotransferase [Gammaproteobacteria bacterium]|nr:sulfotransferase [Gammaproteobacteria bacterium]